MRLQPFGGLHRARNAPFDPALDLRELVNEEVGGRTGAHTDPGIRGAVVAGELEPLLGQVHRDDAPGALQPCAYDGAQADHAGSKHHNRRPGLDRRAKHRCSQPGRQTTCEQTGRLERSLG